MERTSFFRRAGRNVFMACVGLLIVPSLLVWAVRGGAFAAQCAPGPDPCRGFPLGSILHDTLTLAWAVGTNTWLLLGVASAAAIAAMFMRRPLLGASVLLLLPLFALILPMMAVNMSLHPGCVISESGVGDCMLWGAQMGAAVHDAGTVPALIYGFAPFSFALSLVLGVFGWFIARERPRGHAHASMHNAASGTSFRVPTYRFKDGDQA